MAKRSRKMMNGNGSDAIVASATEEVMSYSRHSRIAEYMTTAGILVKFKSVPSLLIEKVQSSVVYPDAPTYTVDTVSGEQEVHPHNETTLEVLPDYVLAEVGGDQAQAEELAKKRTAENKKAWAAYRKEYEEAEYVRTERMTKAMVMLGMDFDYDPNGEWVEMQRFLSVDVPEDPMERKYHYIQTVVFGVPEDMNKILTGIMSNAGVPDASLREVEDIFRSSVEEETAEGTGSDNGKLGSQ